MNFKKELSPSKPLLYSTQLAIHTQAAYKSRNCLRKILPAADLGIASINSMPPRSCL